MDRLTQFFRSFRTLILIGAIAAPVLLWPRVSFAYFSAPLSPVYLIGWQAPDGGCPSYEVSNSNAIYSGGCTRFIGYVSTAQVSGTVPVYLLGWQAPDGGCPFYEVSNINAIYPGGCSRFVGYVNTTQVSGTVPVYLLGWQAPDGGCPFYEVSNINASYPEGCTRFIGYVYTSIPAPTTFTLYPTYMIGTVAYAPPGAGSTVGYSNGTVTGTTVTTEATWSREHSESIGIANASVTFGDTYGGTTTHQVDMQTTINSGVSYSGAPNDSINHDYDRISIFLGVNVNGSTDYLGAVTSTVDFSHVADQGFSENGYSIWVGCLRGTFPSSECGLLDFLTTQGVTSADYPAILDADPFANPNGSPPPGGRYVFITSRGYSTSSGTQNFSELNSTTITNTTKTTYTHSVSAQASSPPGPDIPMSVSGKLTWTYSSTTSNRTGSTDQSQFNILAPANGYNGPNTLFVYMDTIFKTFMFSLQ